MEFTLPRSREILERTPATLRALLLGLSPDWANSNEGPSTWSAHEVVAHLIHGERTDWIPRARLILAGDPGATFAPFEREGGFAEALAQPLASLLDVYASLRAANLRALDAFKLGDRELAMTARHPVFGPVTMRQLLSTWAVHDLNHLAQISRVMAKQFRDEVGPWKEFLGILST